MTSAALAPLNIGSLEWFGSRERKAILDLFSARDLEDFAGALGRPRDDLEIQDCLAQLTWRAIRGRRAATANRKDIARQIEKLRAAIAGLSDDAEFALVAQGVDVRELASQAARAYVPDQNGRPPDTERHVLIASLRAAEKHYTGNSSAYTCKDEWYSGPLFTMLRVIETAVAKAQNSDPPLYDALAKSILRSRPEEQNPSREPKQKRASHDQPTNEQYIQENWARWSPQFREAHSRLQAARIKVRSRSIGATTKPPYPS